MAAPSPGSSQQDTESARQFFDQWEIYRKVVEHNYLFHQEAFAAISATLKKIPHPFSFADLGSGDAEWTSRALSGLPVKSYEAVDISDIALDYAKKNLDRLSCPKQFTQANFFDYVKQCKKTYDVVFIGLSFHHLPSEDKARFYPEIRRILNSGGKYLFYEPILEPHDTCREDMLNRWWKLSVEKDWKNMTKEELRKIHDHVFGSDYPETVETYCYLAKKGGFSDARVIGTTPGNFYAVIECMAG